MAEAALAEEIDAPHRGSQDTSTSVRTFHRDEIVSGHFRIVDLLGVGGMGEVYEAEDLVLRGEHVALKTLPPFVASDERSIELLKREIAAARRVTHVNVCRVFDVYQHPTADGPITFFSMELLQGETLAVRLEKCGRMDLETARRLMGQMAAGLDAAHAARVVHGDFKPGNVMLVPGQAGHERVAITDFGVARLVPADVTGTGRSAHTTLLGAGTLAYMAPEQRDRRRVTPAADVYAVGVVAHEMITGRLPFEAAAGSSEESQPSRGTDDADVVDERWQQAILRCLDRDPLKRFQTAGEFVRALDMPVAVPRPKLRTWPIGLAGLAALLMLAIPSVRSTLSRTFFPAATMTGDRVVAVLPFTSRSPSSTDQAFGRGLAAALTDELRMASQLEPGRRRVLVVPAAEVLEADLKTAKEAQRTLSASVLLTGEVDRGSSGTTMTLNVEELDATRGAARSQDRALQAPADMPLLASSAVARAASLVGLPIGPRTLEAVTSHGSRVREAEESYLLGRGLLMGGGANLDAAVEAFQRATRLDAGFAIAHAALSDAYLRKYQATRDAVFIPLAESSGDEAIGRGSSIAYAHVVRGRVYQVSGQRERAIRELQAALEIDPAVVDARRWLAEAHESEGNVRAAEDVYLQEIATYPHYWTPHVNYGSFLIKHGRYREAEANLVNALHYAPDNPRAIGNLAGLYILTERLAAAEAELERAMSLKPEVVVCNNLAWVHIYQAQFPEAVQLMEQAVQLPRADSFHWGNLARAYRWAGRPNQANATYEKAIRLAQQEISHNPRDARIRGNFAQMLAETGQHADALVEIAATLERAPTDVSVLFRSAIVKELTGDRAGALRALESAVRGGYSVVDIRRHPDLARLRDDRRFVDVMSLAPKIAAQ